MRWFRLLPLACLLSLGFLACNNDDNAGDDATTGDPSGAEQPGTTSAEITAADGGEVERGKAKLSIPGGALADDATLTIVSKQPASSLPDHANLQGLTYDLGPNGTEFDKPVALTLPLVKAPGEGKEAVIAYLNEETNSWLDLETTLTGDALSTDILHFSTYVVRIRNTNVDGGDGPVDCSFDACGGDPSGVWEIATACITAEGGDSPFGDKCDEGTIDVDVMADGTLTVADGRYDWNLSLTGNVIFNIPASCVDPLSGGMAEDCNAFADDDSTCTGTLAAGCTCTQPGEETVQDSSGTLEIDGDRFIATEDDDDEPGDPAEFCVQGDTLKIMIHDNDDEEGESKDILLTFTR